MLTVALILIFVLEHKRKKGADAYRTLNFKQSCQRSKLKMKTPKKRIKAEDKWDGGWWTGSWSSRPHNSSNIFVLGQPVLITPRYLTFI